MEKRKKKTVEDKEKYKKNKKIFFNPPTNRVDR